MICATVLGTSMANASGNWAIQPTANPSGVRDVSLGGISCPSTTVCFAVGSAGALPLVERWNGSGWVIQTPPGPIGAESSELKGVSCFATNACTAVGDYVNNLGVQVTLAERWDGSSWTIQPTPNKKGAYGNVLAGVSCPSISVCIAVGDSPGVVGALAERWDGSSWTIQSTDSAGGNDAFTGVSCAATTACMAVGVLTFVSGCCSREMDALAERWNGSSWSDVSPATVGYGSTFAGVSCPSTIACTAVGSYTDGSGGPFTLAERWSGSSWAVQSSPNPGTYSNALLGVSCPPSTGHCTAVGFSYNSSGGQPALAEGWNGSQWTVQSSSNVPVGLTAVACVAAAICTATGSYGDTSANRGVGLAAAWDGSTWTVQSTPESRGIMPSQLSAIACSATTACSAVGSYRNASGRQVSLAERWNGSSWSTQSTSDAGSQLNSVSCPATTICTAVGGGIVDVLLAERWNGKSWTVQSTPDPSAYHGSALNGVSCPPGSGHCIAVGWYVNSNGQQITLAETWNGSVWAVQPTPNPSGSSRITGLNAVSCSSTSACTAVGSVEVDNSGTYLTLAERWNGSAWAVQSTPNPSAAQSSVLTGVSCASATACTAVGYYINSAGRWVSLAERWNGSAWTTQSTPNLSGAQATALSAVSCPSTTLCTAVGDYHNSAGVQVTLAWDGSGWVSESTSNPTGAKASVLRGIACSSTTTCTGAGSDYNASGIQLTLAEVDSEP